MLKLEEYKKINILYVEDELSIAKPTKDLFSKIFGSITHFENGKFALDYYLKYSNNLDIIITDINMPIMNGIELAKNINKNLFTKKPIIAISAHTKEEIGFEIIDKNFKFYIRKPFNLKELLNDINEIIKEKNEI